MQPGPRRVPVHSLNNEAGGAVSARRGRRAGRTERRARDHRGPAWPSGEARGRFNVISTYVRTCRNCTADGLSREDLEEYFQKHADRLRGDGLTRFEGKFTATRRILHSISL